MKFIAERGGEVLPAFPVILGATVFDRYDRIAADQRFVVSDDAVGIECLAFACQDVLAVLEELAGGGIERECHVLAGAIAGGLAGLGDEAERFVG